MLTTEQKIEKALAERELRERTNALRNSYDLDLAAAWTKYFERLKAVGIPLGGDNVTPV